MWCRDRPSICLLARRRGMLVKRALAGTRKCGMPHSQALPTWSNIWIRRPIQNDRTQCCPAAPPAFAASPEAAVAAPALALSLSDLLSSGARLTSAAQAAWAQVLRPGDTAVDATCGNGHDTLFLAQAVGPSGHVHGFDIQEAAVATTRERLDSHLAAGTGPRLSLHRACHSRLQELCGSGVARVVAFNLGYLPGARDKRVITTTESTVAAVEAALEVVMPGGLISILAYVGHPGGQEEYEAVKRLVSELSPSYWVSSETRLLNRPTAPVLLLLWRRNDVLPGKAPR